MTRTETLAKARAIAQGTTCFLLPAGRGYQICRRVAGRVITIGTRADASQALSLLRRVASH
jgi:hypothetical protein